MTDRVTELSQAIDRAIEKAVSGVTNPLEAFQRGFAIGEAIGLASQLNTADGVISRSEDKERFNRG